MGNKPTLLLDEPVLGIDVYLRDLGWTVVNIREAIGQGKDDDVVVELAKKSNFTVVTPDRKLAKRCRNLGVPVVELGVEIFAEAIHRRLSAEVVHASGTTPETPP